MTGAIKDCTSGRYPTCSQCGLCCTSISGTKSVPSPAQITDLDSLNMLTRRSLLLVMDCPHLTAHGTCGVYDIRLSHPSAFPDCGTFTGQKNGFIYKLCNTVLNPLGDELEIIYLSAARGDFDGMEVSFESHFRHCESFGSLWEKCLDLFAKIKEAKWGHAKMLIYFENTFLLPYLRKNEKSIKARLLIKGLFRTRQIEEEFLNFLFPPSNNHEGKNADQKNTAEYA